MWVTNAFRKENQKLGGTIVTPASKSNHLVGHAIDMNLETPRIASQISFHSFENTHKIWAISNVTL